MQRHSGHTRRLPVSFGRMDWSGQLGRFPAAGRASKGRESRRHDKSMEMTLRQNSRLTMRRFYEDFTNL
jgi:hypothetical protein